MNLPLRPGGGYPAAGGEYPMKSTWLLAAIALLPLGAMAQNALPSGTILPVQLENSINSGKLHTGQQIKARVTQNIPGTGVRKGAVVLGEIVNVNSPQSGQSRVEFRFNAIETNGQRIPLVANLRALASPAEIEDAQISDYGPDAGVPFSDATTIQVGGEQNYHGWSVKDGTLKVAQPLDGGVLGKPRANPGMGCRAAIGNNNQPQALWLFSTNACGVYGYDNLKIEHAGRTAPVGSIVISSEDQKIRINSGSGLLLRVQGS